MNRGGNGGNDDPTIEEGPADPSDYSRAYAEWLAAQGGYGGMWPGAGALGGDYGPGGEQGAVGSTDPYRSMPSNAGTIDEPQSIEPITSKLQNIMTIDAPTRMVDIQSIRNHPKYDPDPYIVNNSDRTVFFKMEETTLIEGHVFEEGGVYALEPYSTWHLPVDGVATHLHGGMVYKVVNGVKVSVDLNGEVQPTDLVSTATEVFIDIFKPAGWQTTINLGLPANNMNWHKLFVAAANRSTYVEVKR